jgi:hypothetical protein
MAHGRLAGRVREDGRVEEWREGPFKLLWFPIRETLEQRAEYTQGLSELVCGEVVLGAC